MILLALLSCGVPQAREADPTSMPPAILYDAHGDVFCVAPGYKYSANFNLYPMPKGTTEADCLPLKGHRTSGKP